MLVLKEVWGCFVFVVWWVFVVFLVVFFFFIGRIVGFFLGVCFMIVFEVIFLDEVFEVVDFFIFGLLFGIMVVSVYFERVELFKYLRYVFLWKIWGGKDLFCRVCLLVVLLSVVFINDIICVVLIGFVLEICR